MLLAVHRVCSRGSLVQTRVLIGEDKADVEIWELLFDQYVLGAVLDRPNALRLDKEKAPWFRELEVRRILCLSCWDCVLDLVCLVEEFDPCLNDLVAYFLFQSRPKTKSIGGSRSPQVRRSDHR